MEISKLIGCHEYTHGLYDFRLLPKDDRKLDLYVRHNTRMSIYEAKNYELTKINFKTVEAALSGTRKDITAHIEEMKCEEQEILELTVTVELPLLPKNSETIHIPLVKNLKDSEILHAKLGDIKKKLLSNNDTLLKFQETAKTRFIAERKEIAYNGATKEDLISFKLPTGKYIITVSGLMTTNASNYMAVGISKADICPGTCKQSVKLDTGMPPEAQNTPFPYLSRAVIDVTGDEENVTFWGNVGSSYPWTIRNFLMTAERISVD